MSGPGDSEPALASERATWPALDEAARQAICTESAELVADGLRADRTAIVYLAEEGYLTLGGKCGFPRFTLYHNAPVSLSVLEDAAIRARTTLSHDAREDHETQQTLTLQLSEAVSLLCVPFFDSQGAPVGAIYADTMSRVQAFRHKELRFVREFAGWLGARLGGGPDDVAPPRPSVRPMPVQSVEGAGEPKEGHPGNVPPVADGESESAGLSGYVVELVGRFERWIYYS